MSSLSVYPVSSPEIPNKVLTHPQDITSTLAEHGIRFDRWQASVKLQLGAPSEEVIAAYHGQIDTVMTEQGYRAVEVISLDRDHPQKAQVRARFLDEQQLEAGELRFFAAGRGLLTLHINDYVFELLCERNDVIGMPKGTLHWFDIGEHPQLVVIRLFSDAGAGGSTLTGDDIASRFPRLDD